MKRIIITLSLLLLTSCATTTLEKAQTFRAALIVEQDYNAVYESVSNMVLTEKQIDNVITINTAKQAFTLVLEGDNNLDRLQTAAMLEKHYAAAKTAYIELRRELDLSKLNPLQLFEIERFDDSVIILDKRISELANSKNIKDKKDTAYEVLEMLVLSLQIVEMTK